MHVDLVLHGDLQVVKGVGRVSVGDCGELLFGAVPVDGAHGVAQLLAAGGRVDRFGGVHVLEHVFVVGLLLLQAAAVAVEGLGQQLLPRPALPRDQDRGIGGGDPARQLVRVADAWKADLIAMSTHGHRFVSDLIHGTTVDHVRHVTSIPVLLLKAQPA